MSREDEHNYLQKQNLTLTEKVLNKRRFKPQILDLHLREFMLGQAVQFQSQDKTTVDVGASVGLYADAFAKHSQWVHCFEAIPFVHDFRLKSVAERHSNITTYPLAVADFEGASEFWLDDKKLGNNSFSNHVNGQPIQVTVTRLDAHDLGEVGFIKVDTEGHELAALKGAEQTIQQFRPTLMIEIYPKFNHGPVRDTFEWIMTQDYECYYNVRGQGLCKVDSVAHGVDVAEGDIAIHDGDFLFRPKP